MAVSKEEMITFMEVMRKVSGYDFSDYSEKSFCRRLERVLIDNKFSFPQLLDAISKDREFLEKTVRDITVNTTELFRDPAIWHVLKFRILPKLVNRTQINVLHTGCSTGQEIYSMLILLHELEMFDKANVFGSDINSTVLDVAKKGVYKYRHNIDYTDNFNKVIRENPYNYEEYNDVPYSRYFDIDKVKDTITMKPYLVKKPVLKRQDLVREGNVYNTKFDIIFCRNVLIYFNSRLQNKTFELFHQMLFRNGILILGAHESMLGPIANKFIKRGKYYQKKEI